MFIDLREMLRPLLLPALPLTTLAALAAPGSRRVLDLHHARDVPLAFVLPDAHRQLLLLPQRVLVDLDDARVNEFPAEFLVGARDCQKFGALHGHGVVEGDRVEVALLVLGQVLEELLVEALVEDEERDLVAVEKQSQVTISWV